MSETCPSEDGPGSSLWAALYKDAIEAEGRIRAILPHVLAQPAPKNTARAALHSIGELCEHLMRMKATAEADERALVSDAGSNRLLSLKEVAAWLGCSTDKVAAMIDDGTIPHLYIGGMLRVPAERVRVIIETGTRFGRVSQ